MPHPTPYDFGTVFSPRNPSNPAEGVDWKIYREGTTAPVAQGNAPTSADARIAAHQAIKCMIDDAARSDS
jgi:hypothetical protein